MVEGKDIRENTREVVRLRKSIEALNNTLVAIEKNRMAENSASEEGRGDVSDGA
jgi:hypothetical protein